MWSSQAENSEKVRLVSLDTLKKKSYSGSKDGHDVKDESLLEGSLAPSLVLKRHIRLPQAIAIMIGTVGVAIFITPTGVTKEV